MNAIEYFAQNYSVTTTFLSFFALLFCVREAWQVVGWFAEKAGIETARTRRRQETQDMMARHEESIKKLQESVDEMKKDLHATRKENDNRRIKEIRKDILEFAKTLKECPPSREEVESIFEEHDEYSFLLERWGKQNGIVSHAMEEIESYYHTL